MNAVVQNSLLERQLASDGLGRPGAVLDLSDAQLALAQRRYEEAGDWSSAD